MSPRNRMLVVLLTMVLPVFGASVYTATAAAAGRHHHKAHHRRHHRRKRVVTHRKNKPASPSPTPAPTPTPVPSPAPTGTPVFDDEFSGSVGSSPDSSRWSVVTEPSGKWNSELECYTNSTSNISQDGQGHLAITALKGSGSCPYTSGRMETKGLFQAEYGTLEVSMQIPAGQGLWPAFWAIGSDYSSVGWPQCGEIDVMENLGQDPFTAYGSIHGPQGTLTNGYSYTTPYHSPVSLANGFHTYAVTWTPTAISYSIDGNTYATYTPSTLSAGQTWMFNQPFYMLLNLAVGGSWPGSPNSSTQFPATMLVDWVRVYS